jgi:hypothetical protein
MIYRTDEANSRQPDVQTVATRDGETVKRVYFNHSEREETDEAGEGEEPRQRIVHVANFIELPTVETEARAIARQYMQQAINDYDNSEAVNQFEFNVEASGITIPYWLPVAKRAQIRESVSAWKAARKGNYKLDVREYDMTLEIPCAELLAMLQELEVYAVKCYNQTSEHLKAIDDMEMTVEDILNYDFTTGYPEKLAFTI